MIESVRKQKPAIYRARIALAATIAALLGASGVAIVSATGANAASACKPYLFIGVRASGEPQGMGRAVGPVYDRFAARVGASNVKKYALVYPAVGQPVWSDTTMRQFFNSVDIGTTALVAHVQKEVAACPKQKIVISGWSQGATVIDRALRELPIPIAQSVSGIALLGDPRFNPDFTGNVGDYDPGKRGVIRLFLPFYGGLQYVPSAYVAKTRSYCVAGDPVCNYTSASLVRCFSTVTRPDCAHAQYVARGHTTLAADFLAAGVR